MRKQERERKVDYNVQRYSSSVIIVLIYIYIRHIMWTISAMLSGKYQSSDRIYTHVYTHTHKVYSAISDNSGNKRLFVRTTTEPQCNIVVWDNAVLCYSGIS